MKRKKASSKTKKKVPRVAEHNWMFLGDWGMDDIAARQIQRVWRGYRSRYNTWKYGGTLNMMYALKIQRVYRGHIGRKSAGDVFYKYATLMANRINRMYRCWKARKTVRLTKVQSSLNSHDSYII